MNRLHIRSLTSIGTVTAGDDPEATIMFYKSLPETVEPGQGPPVEKGDSMPFNIESLSDEGRAYVSDLETRLAALSEPEPALPEDLPESVTKRLDEQAAKIAKAEAEMVRISKENEALRDEQATKHYTEMASDVKDLLGDPTEVAPVFKALGLADAEAFDALYAKIANVKAISGFDALLREHGTAAAGGSAVDQINVHAAEIRKNDPAMSFVAAKAQAWSEHPELKALSREEA